MNRLVLLLFVFLLITGCGPDGKRTYIPWVKPGESLYVTKIVFVPDRYGPGYNKCYVSSSQAATDTVVFIKDSEGTLRLGDIIRIEKYEENSKRPESR